MRLSSLVSVAVVPVFLSLIASNATAAGAASSTRVAKRSAPARALPAPIATSEPLPPLPPAPIYATSFTRTTSAPMPTEQIEVLPALPPSSPPAKDAPAAASPKKNEASEADAPKGVDPSGFILQVGAGLLAPATSFAAQTSPVSPGISFEARLGYYFSAHVGILSGARGSYGHKNGLCSGSGSCVGYSRQVPVLLQFAHKDRAHGFYGEIGVGLATEYGGTGDGYSFALSSPAELKLGMGYRIAGAGGVGRTSTLDMALGMDIGELTKAEAKVGATKLEADITDRTTHLVLALSLIAHFSL